MRISDWSSDVCSSDLGAADQQFNVVELETVTYQATHGFSSQLCVAVRLQAGLRIEHVVPRLDAVAAQHDRACARWPAADLSEHGLHAGVVDGRVRQHRCHARDVGLIRHDGRLPCIASVPEPEGCSKYCFWARMRPGSSGRTSTRSSMLSGTMLTIIAVRKIAYSSSPGLRTMLLCGPRDRKSTRLNSSH